MSSIAAAETEALMVSAQRGNGLNPRSIGFAENGPPSWTPFRRAVPANEA
jgi:hypothetical protein